MENIRYFNQDIDVEDKRVIIRLDLNVPINNKKINDTTRIDLCIPFIKSLLKKKAKILIISHLGRPGNIQDKKYSLEPIFEYLKTQINNNIYFYSEIIDETTREKTSFIKQGEIVLFENIRFNDGEIANDEKFAKNLSTIGEIYINDAFSCSHRKQASVHKITKYLKNSFGGPSLIEELKSINMILNNQKKPVSCIIGGSKVSTKIGVITSLIKKIDNLIIVGAMANNFIKFKGFKIGKSLVETNSSKIIEDIYKQSSIHGCNIIIPFDFAVSDSLNGKAISRDSSNILENEIILDIGPQTINKINEAIDKSRTLLWNGPAGYFENENFSKGTTAIAKKISANTNKKFLISIVGGGDTVSAIKDIDLNLNFTHLSTAGGAFLEYLEGKNLPGIEVLK